MRLGAIRDARVLDVVDVCAAAGVAVPTDAVAAATDPDVAAAIARASANAAPLDGRRFGVPIPRPGKIFALAANYPSHAEEVGEKVRDRASSVPHVFPKLPSTMAGDGDPIVIPSISDMVDYEVELGVVIGRAGRDVAASDALGHVAGYVVFNDVSARRVLFPRRPAVPPEDAFWDFLYGKWCQGFAIVGPQLVTADEIEDPYGLAMELRVNGEVRQEAVTGEMLFDIADAITFLSSICTLEPGDLIAMGTPSGIGELGAGCLAPDDIVEARIEGLGTLTNQVVANAAPG
jgi:2-keto-4-pentenoate hydratase/2-oxohepta-3-ene-1,7-dioic acid hydratase in catechol pathway